jgi:hypothetical protein
MDNDNLVENKSADRIVNNSGNANVSKPEPAVSNPQHRRGNIHI